MKLNTRAPIRPPGTFPRGEAGQGVYKEFTIISPPFHQGGDGQRPEGAEDQNHPFFSISLV